ncbi:hypothetical protein D3C81_1636300 [compost metagenome]
MACQTFTSTPGRPCSAAVGMSLKASTRRDCMAAYGFSAPAFSWPAMLVVWSHIRLTWPPRMSVSAGAVPLYGTVVSSVWIALWNSRPHRCEAEPIPALASDSLLALALMYGTRSLKVAGGSCLLPTSTIGTSATSPTISKSLSGSKPRFRYSAGAVDMPM